MIVLDTLNRSRVEFQKMGFGMPTFMMVLKPFVPKKYLISGHKMALLSFYGNALIITMMIVTKSAGYVSWLTEGVKHGL